MENKRLTRNQDDFWGKDNYRGEKYIIGSDGVTSKQMCLNKLGKLEDLEQQLGCPLEVLFKAIRDGIAYETVNDLMESEPYVQLYYDGKWFGLDIGNKIWAKINPDYFKLSDYKKTWWLKENREE